MGQKQHLNNANGWSSNICAPERSLLVKSCSSAELEQPRNAIHQRLRVTFHVEKERLPFFDSHYYAQPLTEVQWKEIHLYVFIYKRHKGDLRGPCLNTTP